MIFEKIRERLQEKAERYQESIEIQHCIDARWIEEEGLQATEEAIDIINQVEAEYKAEYKDENVNIITDYLQFVRDNADNYDTKNKRH